MSELVQRCADLDCTALVDLFEPLGVEVVEVAAGRAIPGSHWGAPEAGIVGSRLYVRPDTPVHSALHEGCHLLCMDGARRAEFHTDAGGCDLEESAVCVLQIVLADRLRGSSASRLMADMDAWGYSFRLGDTRSWYERDAEDARRWLIEHGVLDAADTPRARDS